MDSRRRIQSRDLIRRLGVDPSTLRRWYTAGSPGFRAFPAPHFLGNRRLWWEDEVEAWETANEKPAPPTCNLPPASSPKRTLSSPSEGDPWPDCLG